MDVVVMADGAIYAAGSRTTRSSGEDRWLVRFDLSGAIIWERSYDTSPTYERLLALARDGKALYATGTRNTDDKLDLWLGRLDLDGNLEWETEVSSGFGNDYATGLAVTGDGDVIVAGLVKSALKWVDIWTSRYSPDGNGRLRSRVLLYWPRRRRHPGACHRRPLPQGQRPGREGSAPRVLAHERGTGVDEALVRL
jgi:outer membrane protein assembly factor BamB